jgi:type II secretory ATPase GspE/PulE/Tfp pilus assembly ATPase PilB-like protein
MRAFLRADPDVIMIGEMRDEETAAIGIEASLTGHLVFSTLHTNDALGGISRLIDMGVEPFLLAAAVRAFLAQRLVRRLCPHCKKPREMTMADRVELGIPLDLAGQAYDAAGCDQCRNTGFSGRLAIYEAVLLTQPMQDLIAHGAAAAQVRAQAVQDGFLPMRGYGWHKVMQGQTTIEEVISVTSSDLGGEV